MKESTYIGGVIAGLAYLWDASIGALESSAIGLTRCVFFPLAVYQRGIDRAASSATADGG